MRTSGLVVLSLVVLATACGGWSKKDTAMEVAFATATVADWAQTRGIVGICQEENPIMGECGERVPVDVFFPVAIVSHAVVAAMLPPRWRAAWLGISTGVEVNQIWRNHANGYALDGSVPPPPPGFTYSRSPNERR